MLRVADLKLLDVLAEFTTALLDDVVVAKQFTPAFQECSRQPIVDSMHHLKDYHDSLGFVGALHYYNSDLKQIRVGQRLLAKTVDGRQTRAERIAGVIANMSEDCHLTDLTSTLHSRQHDMDQLSVPYFTYEFDASPPSGLTLMSSRSQRMYRYSSARTPRRALDATSSEGNFPDVPGSEPERQPEVLDLTVSEEGGNVIEDDAFVLDQPTYNIGNMDELIISWTK